MKKNKGLIAIALMGAMFLSCFSYVKTKAETVEAVPIYRLYHYWTGEHFYTKNKAEADILVSAYGWDDEGIGWYSPKNSKDYGDPVYRFYSPTLGVHRYTADKTECEALLYYGWNEEGIICYSAKSGGSPVFRLKNPGNEQENFTLNPAEAAMNINFGWVNEPFTFYAVKTE